MPATLRYVFQFANVAVITMTKLCSLLQSYKGLHVRRKRSLHSQHWIDAEVEAEVDLFARALKLTKVLNTEGTGDALTRNFARSNLAALKQESGDVTGAIEEYKNVLS